MATGPLPSRCQHAGLAPASAVPTIFSDVARNQKAKALDPPCGIRAFVFCAHGKLAPMATKTLITIEEYLRTSFEPGADYVDGGIVERNVGGNQHSKVQVSLVAIFLELRKKHPVHIRTELHMRIALTRFRVADVAVWVGEEPSEPIPSLPPLLVAEIVSPDDRYTEIIQKLEDYRNWGVRHI